MNHNEVCFFSVQEFAKILKVSDQVIRRLLREGKLKSVKLTTADRARHRIPKSELYRLQSAAYGQTEEV